VEQRNIVADPDPDKHMVRARIRGGLVCSTNAERLTDVELMEAVVHRDPDAVAKIYERYESMLRVVISTILHEGGETDDGFVGRLYASSISSHPAFVEEASAPTNLDLGTVRGQGEDRGARQRKTI
jgi:hypothetical protein